jgi:hypothetical protein
MTIPTPFRLFFALLFVLPCFDATAQTTIESLLEQPVTDLPAYDTTRCKDCIFIRVTYGTSSFINLDVLKRFEGNNITEVEMVFSSFSRSEGFDQVGLNRQRLSSLQKAASELFDDMTIKWTVLRQTACKSLEESERLFHGFVVHITPGKSVRDRDGKLAPVAEATKMPSKLKPRLVTRDSVIREMSVSMRQTTKRDCELTGKYVPNDKKKARKGIRYDTKGRGRKPEKKCVVSHGYAYDTSFFDRKFKVDAATGRPIDRSLGIDRRGDTTVTDVMDRKWSEWKSEKIIVVQDVTGSMSSYLTQTLIWHELYAAKGVEHYLFFNDGDNKPDGKKILGKTGGIYYIASNRLSDIQETAHRASKAGSGGDGPENNVEALIAAQNKCTSCSSMVMIADNFASVKDMALLGELKKPVHIVVCGGNGEQVHSDYLSIAAVTGGSVHTVQLDMDLKGKAVEGFVLNVMGRAYIFSDGRFSLKQN